MFDLDHLLCTGNFGLKVKLYVKLNQHMPYDVSIRSKVHLIDTLGDYEWVMNILL